MVVVLICSHAFDLCKFDKLITEVLRKGMPPILVRVIINMYEEQYAWVSWGEARSATFSIVNVRCQGSIASPVLWSVVSILGPTLQES